ncbi:FUSC family protein [Streptomyces sp. NPDC021080]|uniref:FUSC family protein n=1 Tax=Streptomyces sp. NPDC021080 TaxID=3365110 RepID=UPI0037B9975F
MFLRTTAVGMATVLGTYGLALLVEHEAGLHVDSVVQAVVIASALGRVQRLFDRTDRLLACVVLPCAAAAGTELSTLIQQHPDAGDAAFVVGVAGAIWVRRFGARATRAGTLVVLPLIAVLVVPAGAVPVSGHEHTAWAAVTALAAVVWGTVVTWTAQHTGLVPRPPSAKVTTAPPAPRRRPTASTRMALQMAAALTAAFVIGRNLWPDHWAWVVLTAFLVCSGARSRGDVLVKGAWRTLGAAAGTVVATAVSGQFGPRSDAAVVVIFVVLAVATWLRELSYAYWAGCVTAVLSLLYDWFGQSPGDLLHTRLAGIAVGAVLGVAASWLVLPVRTEAVVRARTAAALSGLGELMEADWLDGPAVRVAQDRFAYRVEQLAIVTAPMRVLAAVPVPRSLSALWQPDDLTLRTVAALRRCAEPVDDLADAAGSAPDALTADPAVARGRARVAAHALGVRRAIGRRPAPPAPAEAASQERFRAPGAVVPAGRFAPAALAALDAIDSQLDVLSTLFGPPPVYAPDAAAAAAG